MSNPQVDKATGQAKELLGKVTDDKSLETEGKLDQAGAAIREAAGEVADGVTGVVGKLIDSVGDAATSLKDKLSGKS